MTEQAGYLEFIESFNHIHKYLKKYTIQMIMSHLAICFIKLRNIQ